METWQVKISVRLIGNLLQGFFGQSVQSWTGEPGVLQSMGLRRVRQVFL